MDEDERQVLHARLLAGDPTATADACEALLPELAERLCRAFPRDCPDLAQEAAERALLDYVKEPARFPHPGCLFNAARCDLSNLRRREGRHHHARVAVVELDAFAGNGNTGPLDALVRRELCERTLDAAGDLRAVLELMFDGQRSTAVFAEALGIADLAADEQERLVKRAKDRVMKRVQRRGAGHGAA